MTQRRAENFSVNLCVFAVKSSFEALTTDLKQTNHYAKSNAFHTVSTYLLLG